MSVAQQNLEIARLAAERWNANDLEGVLELYATDAVMLSGPDWPEQDSWEGREALRRNFEDWRDVWESSVMEVDGLESIGEGGWSPRGRGTPAAGRAASTESCPS